MIDILKGFLRTVLVPFGLSLIGGLIDRKLGGAQPTDTKTPPAA